MMCKEHCFVIIITDFFLELYHVVEATVTEVLWDINRGWFWLMKWVMKIRFKEADSHITLGD